MKSKSIALAAAILGLSATSVFATTTAAHDQSVAAIRLDVPVPAKVVAPTDLPRRYEGATVRLSLTIDAAGVPHDIKVVSTRDNALTRSLVTAVSQWRFTPARRNGTPVSTKVELPIELAAS